MHQAILDKIHKWDKYNLRAKSITKLMVKRISANLFIIIIIIISLVSINLLEKLFSNWLENLWMPLSLK